MKKITTIVMGFLMVFMVGCTNLDFDSVLAGLSDTLTLLTGNINKTITLPTPKVDGVIFKEYRLDVIAERNGDYTQVEGTVRGYVANNRDSTVEIRVQMPIYDGQGRILGMLKRSVYLRAKSSDMLDMNMGQTYRGAIQLNQKGALTSIYAGSNFLGDSEGTTISTTRKKVTPKKKTVVAKPAVQTVQKAETPAAPVKQVRQQRRTR